MAVAHPGSPVSLFRDYALTGFDELFACPGDPRPHYAALHTSLADLGPDDLERRSRLADRVMKTQGITFTVYGQGRGVERIMPFDPIPRLVPADEWVTIERGLEQRVRALNLFVHDIYHDRRILRDRIVPPELVLSASGYRPEVVGLRVPRDVYIHVSGIDLIRDPDGRYLVLEDNARTPSGVSYVLKNRQVMRQAFPFMFAGYNVQPVDDVRRRPARRAAPHRSAGVRQSDGGGADAGRLQLRIFRAHVPGPADGRATGRGPRPGPG